MTPEANIRVDLLIIWPILAILSVWALYRVARKLICTFHRTVVIVVSDNRKKVLNSPFYLFADPAGRFYQAAE